MHGNRYPSGLGLWGMCDLVTSLMGKISKPLYSVLQERIFVVLLEKKGTVN